MPSNRNQRWVSDPVAAATDRVVVVSTTSGVACCVTASRGSTRRFGSDFGRLSGRARTLIAIPPSLVSLERRRSWSTFASAFSTKRLCDFPAVRASAQRSFWSSQANASRYAAAVSACPAGYHLTMVPAWSGSDHVLERLARDDDVLASRPRGAASRGGPARRSGVGRRCRERGGPGDGWASGAEATKADSLSAPAQSRASARTRGSEAATNAPVFAPALQPRKPSRFGSTPGSEASTSSARQNGNLRRARSSISIPRAAAVPVVGGGGGWGARGLGDRQCDGAEPGQRDGGAEELASVGAGAMNQDDSGTACMPGPLDEISVHAFAAAHESSRRAPRPVRDGRSRPGRRRRAGANCRRRKAATQPTGRRPRPCSSSQAATYGHTRRVRAAGRDHEPEPRVHA